MGKVFFVIFLQEIFRVQFLPEGSARQWEGGVVSALYLLQARVLITCNFLPGTLRKSFTNVCTCAHLHVCLLHCIHASSFALTH